MPQKMPSSAASRRAIGRLSAVVVVMIPDRRATSRFSGMKPSPMPSMPCGPPLASRQQGALLGLDRVEPHARVLLAQEAADAGERAAAALRGDKGADDSAGLLPDLGPGRPVVRLDVVGVVELAGHPVAGAVTRADLPQTLEREVHVALAAGREDEVGPVGAHDLLALVAHALGHDDRAAIAFDGSHERAGDPGIPGRALEHAHAPAQIAPGLGAVEHVQINTVFEAAGGAVPLELHVDR